MAFRFSVYAVKQLLKVSFLAPLDAKPPINYLDTIANSII